MLAALLPAWDVVKGLPWKWIGIALAILFAIREIERHGYHERDAEVAGLKGQITSLKAASKLAAQQNVAEVKTQEAAQADHTKDGNHDDQIRAAAADDAVAAYKRLHQYQPPTGSCGALGLPACRDAAGAAATADANALVHDPVVVPGSDLDICKAAVLKGQSFDAWWPGAAKIVNDAADASEKAAADDAKQ